MIPHSPDAACAAPLREFFLQNRFTPEGLKDRLQNSEPASRKLQDLPLLLYRTREQDSLDLLIRYFMLGYPISRESAERAFPPEILQDLAACNLIPDGEQSTAPVCLSPFEDGWFATDTYERLWRGNGEDDVLMINATTLFLLNMAIRTPARSLLDLGTGCGVVGINAAAWAEQVTATDLTERACAFARFNAALNGAEGVEVLQGDSMAPVEGRRFDRILSNPPFYISPNSGRIFAENPAELDGFCRGLLRQASAQLEEGGYLQMLVEWAEIDGEPWQDRIADWVRGTGCDAVVITGGRYDPVRYADSRLQAVVPRQGSEADLRPLEEWIAYYRRYNVTALHAGFVTLRRRSGDNWLHIEKANAEPMLFCGDAIEAYFQRRDRPFTDRELLDAQVQIAEGVTLQRALRFSGNEWAPLGPTRLVQTTGLALQSDLTEEVAEFVSDLDGQQTLAQVIGRVAESAPAPPEVVERECIAAVRRLMDRGFLVVPAAGTGAASA